VRGTAYCGSNRKELFCWSLVTLPKSKVLLYSFQHAMKHHLFRDPFWRLSTWFPSAMTSHIWIYLGLGLHFQIVGYYYLECSRAGGQCRWVWDIAHRELDTHTMGSAIHGNRSLHGDLSILACQDQFIVILPGRWNYPYWRDQNIKHCIHYGNVD